MANPQIKLKRSATQNKRPIPDNIPLGELAINTYDGYLYASKDVGAGTTIITINPWRVGTGTDSFNIDFTAGNVGINSSIPTALLDVNGDVNISGVSTFNSTVNATDIIKGYKYTAAPYGSTTTITVTVASKTAAHRYNGTGSSSGYVFDGLESPFITLTPGRTYKFDQADNSNSSHQIKFYLEADKTTLYEGGVTYNGTAGSAGAYTQIVVGDDTPTVLHYMCVNHAYMGNSAQVNSNVVNTNYEAILRGNLKVSGIATATTFSGSGASLTTLNASELDSGTIPDARFPATLPAASGANLTNLPAANITGTLPAISGVNLTGVVTSITAGSNITLTGGPTGAITIAAAAGGTTQNLFETIAVSGQSDVVADSATDTLTLVAGSNMTITTNAGGDSITFAGGGGGDTVSIESSATDILSVSSGAISADDAGADKLVFWDDSAGKLTYLTVGSNLTVTDTTIAASGGGGSSGPDPVIMGMIF